MKPENLLPGTLARLESRLQSLVEGSLALIFSPRIDLPRRLFDAMQNGLKPLADGRIAAPNFYYISTSKKLATSLQKQPELLEDLSRNLENASLEAGFTLLEPIIIQATEVEDYPDQKIEINAFVHLEALSQTTDLVSDNALESLPAGAFLVVNGIEIFSLAQPVINIGRRPDNQLVIDDPRISRIHAQLRAVKGRYVIFDLDSTGGTQVNGKTTLQSVLFPGDVILLAGIPLVYGQEESGLSETHKYQIEPGKANNDEGV